MTEFWPWVPILSAAFLFLVYWRLLAYLRYFQQEGYDHLRFLRWVNVRPLTDPAFWLAIASAFLMSDHVSSSGDSNRTCSIAASAR